MSIPSLLILFLLISQFAFPYTVITISGKKIQGTLISEQEATILIKDASGVLISFKKEILDLEAMKLENAPSTKMAEIPQRSKKKTEPTIAQIAQETRKQRKGLSRALSLEDLEKTPRLSVFGSESVDLSTNTKDAGKETNDHWESRILALKKEVNRLRERKITAEASCEQTKRKQYHARTTPNEKPSDLLATYKESSQCRKMEEISTQLSDAEVRLEDLLEDARRAGVSWRVLE
jgi:hypothetical protein